MLVKITRYVPLFLCLWCCCMHATAQLQPWRHISTAGMSNKNIVNITEDASGLLYMGTHGGVEVFDGRRFMPIVVPQQIEKGINPFVNSLKWGKGGLLWVATRTHVYTYNPANGNVRILHGKHSLLNVGDVEIDTLRQMANIITNEGIVTCKVTDTGLAETGKYLIPGIIKSAIDSSSNLYILAGKISTIYLAAGGKLAALYSDPFIRDFKYLPQHHALVMLTEQGLVTYNLHSKKIDTLTIRHDWDLKSPRTSLSVLTGDQVAVLHPAGIALLRHLTDTSAIWFGSEEKNPASLHGNFFNCAIADQRGNIVVSEDGISICVLTAGTWPLRYLSAKMTGASRLWLSYHDTANKQVIASSEKGLCAIRYTDTRVNYKPEIRPQNLKFFEAMYYTPWNKDELLVLTNGQGSWLFNPTNYHFRSFDTFDHYFGAYTKDFTNISFSGGLKLNDNNYLISGFKGLYQFRRDKGIITELFKDGIPGIRTDKKTAGRMGFYCSYVDKHKNVWLGSGLGLSEVDSNMQLIRNYNGDNGLGNTVILDIESDANDNIYAGTMGGGVYKVAPHDTMLPVPLVTGVNNIYCIGTVDKDHLLITTSNGMCLYNTHNGSSKLINANYGMPVEDFNQFALRINDSLIMASGANGVVIIDRHGLYKCFNDTSRLLVMRDKQVIKSFTLQKGQELLDFDVSVAGYSGAANWAIRYKLQGLDEDWRNLEKGEWHIRYNSVKPGGYTLLIEATDLQNVVWVAPVAVEVTALPYFWQTLWFRLLVLATAITLLVIVVRFFSQLQLKWKLKKLEDEQKIARERIRISRELHDNVGSQLTYLISGLESSNMLLRKQDTAMLEQKIGKMQSSARESMQQLRDSIWALNTESVQASVLLSRFRKWLENIMEASPDTQYSVLSDITSDTEFDPIRSLNLFRIMQESVHNVLKHADATMLSITYLCTSDSLSITIEDNGKGFDMEKRSGNGRKTMASRAEEMGATFTLTSSPGSGTKITLVMAITS